MNHSASEYSSDDENINEESTMRDISTDAEEMTKIFDIINEAINGFPIPSFFDKSFISSILESDIRNNLRIFKSTASSTDSSGNIIEQSRYLVEIDEYNELYLPMNAFVDTVIPSYITIQLSSAFSELSSIKDVLNSIASTFQDEIERLTIAASEEEFKEAKFNKKDLSVDELDNILTTHTTEKITSEQLSECPLCGKENCPHYYECKLCTYKYCDKCCEEIASRQALCPCCRGELSLIEHAI